MILTGDYHTHTKYSAHNHGKGTILENAQIAAEKGLKEIAITDHGFDHKFFALKRSDIPKIKEELLEAKEKTGVKVLLGVEANLVSLDGNIDVREQDYEFLDVLIMGYHSMVKSKSWHDKFRLFDANNLGKAFSPSLERINRNTTAYLKALDKYPIDIISHPMRVCPIDLMAVARMARQKGTLIELNGKRIDFSCDELAAMASEGVKFILNSDAHTPQRVGECNTGINMLLKSGIDLNQVVNIDGRAPSFKARL